ncbi:hypothetical protein F5887DRAFT_1077244 [Amanita rubescens]|nr:hypothetical protein F5887DRAFT_1077244 [Amanita rubescens]
MAGIGKKRVDVSRSHKNKTARSPVTATPASKEDASTKRKRTLIASSDEEDSNLVSTNLDKRSTAELKDSISSTAKDAVMEDDIITISTDSALPPSEETPVDLIKNLTFKRRQTAGNLSDAVLPDADREELSPTLSTDKKWDRKSSQDAPEQSLKERARRDKSSRKTVAGNTLDSFPDIPDSGTVRMKYILANPFSLRKNSIDNLLKRDYSNLPPLRHSLLILYESNAHSVSDEEEHTMISYSKTREQLDPKDGSQARFESAVKFENSGPFINPSRASTLLVSRDSNRIILSGTTARGKTAVFLTTGLLVESCLRKPTVSGYNNTHKVHHVMLTPISGEFERAAAFVGTVFEEDNYHCLLKEVFTLPHAFLVDS